MSKKEEVTYEVTFPKKEDTKIRYWQDRSGLTAAQALAQAYELWIFAIKQKEEGSTLIVVPADQAEHYRALVDFDSRLRERGHTKQVQP